jgi:hypothetical protein
MNPYYEVIDTYPDFLEYWREASYLELDKQIQLWISKYMEKYRELLEKQLECYRDVCMDWKEVAKKIIPRYESYLPIMQEARENLLLVIPFVWRKAVENLSIDFNITMVIYVGIGCGAGWATTYNNRPSILLGLENIVEERWHMKEKLKGLISHEIGHLFHMKLRDEWREFKKNEEDPLFLLYSEGFAQKCEEIILEKTPWHMAPDKEWIRWCHKNKGLLADIYLKRVEKRKPVNDFYGSWLSIYGKSQTGYYLGFLLIQSLIRKYSLEEIAKLTTKEVNKEAIQFLESLVKR